MSEIDDIRRALLDNVSALADYLAPTEPRIDGFRRWSFNPVRPQSRNNSFLIDIAGSTRGRWTDFIDPDTYSGDLIDLISYVVVCRGGSEFKAPAKRGEAIKWAKKWLGMDDAKAGRPKGPMKPDPDLLKRQEEQVRKAREDKERKVRIARRAWLDAAPWPGTLVETYLQARGIPTGDFLARGERLNALRFSEWADPETGEIFPAMLANMSRGRAMCAVHITMIAPDGRGKANIETQKRMLGDPKGAAVRLTKGAGLLTLRQARERGEPLNLAIAEGIENALSFAFIYPGWRCWAVGSLNNIGVVLLPEGLTSFAVIADNDPARSDAAKAKRRAYDHLLARFEEADLQPLEMSPPSAVKDWNDYIKEATLHDG